MKAFLDETFAAFNSRWRQYQPKVEAAEVDFEAGVADLLSIFGDEVARKPGSRQFNRAIFDALIYFQSQAPVREALRSKHSRLKRAYADLFSKDSGFLKAVESDTAGAPNTSARLRIWAEAISKLAGKKLSAPKIPTADEEKNPSRASRPSTQA